MKPDDYDLSRLLPRLPGEFDPPTHWRLAGGLVVLGLTLPLVMLLTVWLGR